MKKLTAIMDGGVERRLVVSSMGCSISARLRFSDDTVAVITFERPGHSDVLLCAFAEDLDRIAAAVEDARRLLSAVSVKGAS